MENKATLAELMAEEVKQIYAEVNDIASEVEQSMHRQAQLAVQSQEAIGRFNAAQERGVSGYAEMRECQKAARQNHRSITKEHEVFVGLIKKQTEKHSAYRKRRLDHMAIVLAQYTH